MRGSWDIIFSLVLVVGLDLCTFGLFVCCIGGEDISVLSASCCTPVRPGMGSAVAAEDRSEPERSLGSH